MWNSASSLARRHEVRLAPQATSTLRCKFPLACEPSKLQLIHELEMIFTPKMVDLVLLNAETDPLLLHEIFAHGRLLFERSEGLFAKGELRAWHLYLDTAPLRRKEREFIKKKFKDRADVA